MDRRVIARFGHRQRFPCQDAFVDLNLKREMQRNVGGHAVAGLHHHQVARHDGRGFDHLLVPVAHHPRLGVEHLAQGGKRGFGAPFLHEAQKPVQQHHQPDRQGVDHFA